MDTTRIARALAVIAMAAGAVIACAPDRAPLAPSAAPRSNVAGLVETTIDAGISLYSYAAPTTVSGLRRTRPLAQDVSVSATIGPRGGRLEIPSAGFTLEVPAGAVALPTSFRVTALAGEMVAYDFGPDGSQFPVALRATQDLRETQVQRLPKRAVLRAGYFRSAGSLDPQAGTASVEQETDATVGAAGKTLTFRIPHFSGWLILWRNGEPVDSAATP